MTVQPHTTPYIGADVVPDETAHLLKVLGFFVKGEERLLAMVTTVKALPKLTHVAVTSARVIGFSAPDLSREGPRQELRLADIAGIETRKSYQQRWFLVTQEASGDETDFGDVHSEDAPMLLELVRTQITSGNLDIHLGPPRQLHPHLAKSCSSRDYTPVPGSRASVEGSAITADGGS